MANQIASNKPTEQQKLATIIAGMDVFPATAQLTLQSQTYSPAQLTQQFQAGAAALAAADKARADFRNAVAAQKAARAKVNALYRTLRSLVEAQWGKESIYFSKMGFQTAPKRVPTAAQKALASAKRVRTRKARNTLGKVQRQKVTADGTLGLQLMSPTGIPIHGAIQGPSAPSAADGVGISTAGPSGSSSK